MESFIQHYGYVAIFIGTFLEGEMILILAGFAAHQGYLNLGLVMMAAFGGSLIGDQLFFYLGWRRKESLPELRPGWKNRFETVQRLIQKNKTLLILGFRFLYGLRTVTPFALGLSHVSWRRFLILNVLGALVWAVAFGCAGYLFGHTAEIFLGDLKTYELFFAGFLLLGGLLVWLLRKRKKF